MLTEGNFPRQRHWWDQASTFKVHLYKDSKRSAQKS